MQFYLVHSVWKATFLASTVALSEGYHSESSSCFINRKSSLDSARDLTLEERWAGAYRLDTGKYRIQRLKVTELSDFFFTHEKKQ